MTRCDYRKLGCSNDGLAIGVEWMCVKHIGEQRALIEQQATQIAMADHAYQLLAEAHEQQAKEIADMKDRLRKLDALEHAGVDNWEWYGDAMQSIAEEEA